jgi:hypothetical protein
VTNSFSTPKWGHSFGAETILVDQTEITIGANLYAALFYLRQPRKKRVLWIDALCINQNDIQERSQQVSLMRRIYMGASQVVSFVGAEITDLDIGLDFIELLNSNLSKQKFLPLVRHYQYVRQWKAVETLWSQEYWRRVWIIQEVVVASNLVICYGHRSVPWARFSGVIKQLMELSVNGELRGYISMLCFTGPAMLDRLRERRELSGQGWPLATLLQLCSDTQTQSTDPRDKIYGLLGLQDPVADHADILYLRSQNDSERQPRGIEAEERSRSRGHGHIRGGSTSTTSSLSREPEVIRARMRDWELHYKGTLSAPKNFPRNNGIEADYSKSNFALWSETMSWPNLWDHFLLLKFSYLVQDVLGELEEDEVVRYMMSSSTITESVDRSSELESRNSSINPMYLFRKALGKQKVGTETKKSAKVETRDSYYTAGLCQSSILFLGPPYTTVKASFKLVRKWIKLYFHPTKKLENTGKLPTILAASITQVKSDLHRIVPITSSASRVKFGEWAYISNIATEPAYVKDDEVLPPPQSLPVDAEDLCLNTNKIPSTQVSEASTEIPKPEASDQPRWFISDRGQFGLAPHSAKEGDSICQFKDCDIVALARPIGGSKEDGELIGRALLMPRLDEGVNHLSKRFKYSIPDARLWERDAMTEELELSGPERVSLYLDLMTLWPLTR